MASKVMQSLQPAVPVDHPAPDDTSDSVDSTSAPAFDYYAAATSQVCTYCTLFYAVLCDVPRM